ncbi:MAG: hypothetical protein HF300_02070 [Ignavibacteria bacterium]|jgi:hypothetical protein|nr:hypothetical protein [Ignavibacteria bacterium]
MAKQSKYNLRGILFSKKAMSLAGLMALTIALTFYFKVNKFQDFFEAQKGSLLSFYTKSLKPLFLGREITNEDIFNFAFYHELPLDRQNRQYLQLGVDTLGKQYVEFRDVSAVQKTNNLEAFSKNLDLNPRQRHQMDSILSSYGEKIKSQILVNENNTVAINENLWNLNKALLADLFMFASKANRAKFKEMGPSMAKFTDNPQLSRMVSEVKEADVNRFIFVTKDSIFSHDYKFDMEQYRKDAKQSKRDAAETDKDIKLQMKFEKDYAKNMKKNSKKLPDRQFMIYMDSTRFRIRVPEVPPVTPEIPDMEEIAKQIEMATRQLKHFNIKMRSPVVPNGRHSKTPQVPDVPAEDKEEATDYFELNIDLPDVDSIIEESLKKGGFNEDGIKKLRQHPDSPSYVQGGLDSLKRLELRESMKKVREELKKLKKVNKQKTENREP